MADDTLKPRHRWALLALMALGGEISNPDLKRRSGIDVKKEERERLIAEGYLSSEKEGRSFFHRLTESGWEWCQDELSGDWSGGNGSADGALYAFLGLVGRYLDRTGQSLGEFYRKGTESAEEQIRAAYRKLAAKPGDWVSLTDLRPLLHGFERSEVDETLLAMSRTPRVHVVPDSNQKALTSADRAAAVRIGGEDSHSILIEEA